MVPSGSGKSTLLNLMGALDLPDQGEILFRGQSLARMDNLNQFRAAPGVRLPVVPPAADADGDRERADSHVRGTVAGAPPS